MALNDIANKGAWLEIDFNAISRQKPGKDYDGITLVDVGIFSHDNGYTYAKAITIKDADGNVYVHYNGTGDGNWHYNAAAYEQSPSLIQQWALSYFDSTISKYYEGEMSGDLYVTGHSQGANNAQFVTLRSQYGDYIVNCVSIDGSGFSTQSVADSKRLYGEAHFERQREKIWAYNGAFDFVGCMGQTQIVPDGQTVYIDTPAKSATDNIMYIFHDVRWMCDEFGKFNNIVPEENEYQRFLTEVTKKFNTYPQEQQERVAQILMMFSENMVSKNVLYTYEISSNDLEELITILIPLAIDLLASNHEMIAPVLRELGFGAPLANAVDGLVSEFNKLSPASREEALLLLAQAITIKNNELDIDFSNIDRFGVLAEVFPAIWETALYHPWDALPVMLETGVDKIISDLITDNVEVFSGVLLGAGAIILIVPWMLPASI